MLQDYIDSLYYQEDKDDVIANGEHTTRGGSKNWVYRVYKCQRCGGPTEPRKVGLTFSLTSNSWKRDRPYCNKCAREVIVEGSKSYCKQKGTAMPDEYINSLYFDSDREYVRLNGERTTDGYDKEGNPIVVKRVYRCVRCGNQTEYKAVRNVWIMKYKRWRNCGPLCTECAALNSYSSEFEIEVKDYIKSIYKGSIKKVKGLIKSPTGYPMELDIYLPDVGVAFECNGECWHQEERKSDFGRLKFKGYHDYKVEACRGKGIKLIHIWYRDWCRDKEIIKSRIKDLIGQSSTF